MLVHSFSPQSCCIAQPYMLPHAGLNQQPPCRIMRRFIYSPAKAGPTHVQLDPESQCAAPVPAITWRVQVLNCDPSPQP